MAILTPTDFYSHTGISATGDDAASVSALCHAVDAAVKRMIRPFHPEPLTVTDAILDAPPDRDLYLPVLPVRSVASVYYRADANGLAANFTSDYLIDNTDGDEYQLLIDDHVNNYARRGVLRRVGRVWGQEWYSPPEKLAYRLEPRRGALKVTFAAGPLSVPADITAAAVVACVLMYERRKKGAPLNSESFGGYSYSMSGQFTAEAAVRSPEVLALLAPYLSLRVA